MTVTIGRDKAPTEVTPQRAVQLLADPYMANPTPAQHLNPAAFGFRPPAH